MTIQWLAYPTSIQADTLNTQTTAVDRAVTRVSETVDPDDRRELVANIDFNQPSDASQARGGVEIAKFTPEEKLAEVNDLSGNAMLSDQQQGTQLATKLEVDPEEFRSLLKVDINYLIEQWRQAWQSGDSETYLSFYSAEFISSEQISLQNWQQQRKLRVVPTKKITVKLSNFDVTLDEANRRSVVSFDQEYRSSTYSDTSRKQLTLIKEDEWRIISELVL